MRKIIFYSIAICLPVFFSPIKVSANPDSRTEISVETAKAQTLVKRLKEIEAMDISVMSRSEKKALRKEIRSIDRELRAIHGGVYISAGAIIVILILLLIFL